jgi:transposase
MSRDELERLSKQELIELVLRLQRPHKTSRTSSKPPSTDPKQRRERSKPGGAKPGHKGHSRTLSQTADRLIDHRPQHCPCCQAALGSDLPAEPVSLHDRIDLPDVTPVVERHRRLAVQCPACGARVVAPLPPAIRATPFGPRLHAVATYLKTFQALSYERLQGALADLSGLTISQGGLMNVLRRAQGRFQAGREDAVTALRRAEVVACDATSVRIAGTNAYHWVFRCKEAVVHHAAASRAASVVRDMMGGHHPKVGCRIAIRPSRAMRRPSRPAWRIWHARWLTRVRRARIPCRCGWSCGCDRCSTFRARSRALRRPLLRPSSAPWSADWPTSFRRRAGVICRAISSASSVVPATSF